MNRHATEIRDAAAPPGVLRGLLRYRDLWWELTVTDARLRYVGSIVGPAWALLHPIIVVALLAFVFSHVLGARGGVDAEPRPFALWLSAVFLPWMGFQEIIVRSTTVFRDQANLVKKVAFPPVLLHATVTTVAALNLALLAGLGALALLAGGHLLPPSAILWPVVVLLQLLLAAGLGLCLSVANVFLRDMSQLVAAGLQLWFWLTPIVYPADVLPEGYRLLRYLNPLSTYAEVQRNVLRGVWPSMTELAELAAISAAALLAGSALLARLRRRIPDEL